MLTVTVYIKNNCVECEQVILELKELADEYPHRVVVVNIDDTPELYADTFQGLPVVKIGPYTLHYPFTKQEIMMSLGAARDRSEHLNSVGDQTYLRKVEHSRQILRTDMVSLWLSKHYMLLINLILAIFVGLPFLAPVLMKYHFETSAKVIYSVYSPLCHQLAFRSWFLFGEQPYYPRDLAGIKNILTYEDIISSSKIDTTVARKFIGNEVTGYKVALCERDVAIYGSLLLFGLIFSISRRKIRKLPWFIWVAVGLIPIAVDGLSQLPGLATGWPNWLIIRESTPLLRTITGSLFGLTTGWYLFPLLEESMKDARRLVLSKMAVVKSLNGESKV